MNKEQLQFFYDEIMGLFGWDDGDEASGVDPLLWVRKQKFLIRDEVKKWKVAEKMALETVAQLRAELDKMQAKAVEYALIVEQFQKLLGVYTTTSAFEKIAEKDAALRGASNWAAAWLSAHPQEEK